MEEARLISDAQSFLAFLVNGTIISDVSTDYRAKPGQYTSVTRLQRLPASRSIGSGLSLLTGHGGDTRNYFHWLFDVLPRLRLMELAGLTQKGSTYVVPVPRQQYQIDTLHMLGITPQRSVSIQGPTLLEADRMAVAEGHRGHGHVEAWVCEFLRARLGSAGQASAETPARIYINRGDTLVRKVRNEDRLEEALAARGFHSISLGSFAFREQVRLFEGAEVVVGPHGAGLANLVFCRPGTRVVEVGGGGHSWPLFEGIASAVALDYRLVEALEPVGAHLLPTRVRDTRVDVGRTLAVVDDALT